LSFEIKIKSQHHRLLQINYENVDVVVHLNCQRVSDSSTMKLKEGKLF